MNFASLAFACFLPLVWSVYWLMPRRTWQNTLLLFSSYIFYGWWDPRFCALMLGSSLVDYVAADRIYRAETQTGKKRWLIASLCSNLGCLGFFKYFGFFVESLTSAVNTLGGNLNPHTIEIILPVGISFYTFQTLSYTIDVYRGKLEPTRSIIDYLAFVSFFPQLVAGPIERATRLVPQFERDRHFHIEYVQEGSRRILWGLFKKLALADTLAPLVAIAYENPSQQSGAMLAFGTLCFAFQIYCDFSAYSDIALGSAQLFGLRLMRNFAYPYFSQNLREFWGRWHISLSTWFRDYVYIPLGGNRVGKVRQVGNLLATFLVSGLWHGAAFRFVVWGGLHGLGVACSPKPKKSERHSLRRPGGDGLLPSVPVLLRMLSTFSVVCIGWVFFRATSVGEASLIVSRIFGDLGNLSIFGDSVALAASDLRVSGALKWIGAFVLIEWVQRRREYPLQLDGWPEPVRWSLYTLVAWLVLDFAASVEQNPFVYFQF